MKYYIFPLAILHVGSFLVEVTSIDCPHADPVEIPKLKLRILLNQIYHTHKYITAPDFVPSISFPAAYHQRSDVRYTTYQNSDNLVTVYTYISRESDDLHAKTYKFNIDPQKVVLEIIGPHKEATLKPAYGIDWSEHNPQYLDTTASYTLKVALVNIYEENDGSFYIFKSCDGKYAWVQIARVTIQKIREARNSGVDLEMDPLKKFNLKINKALRNLNIENGVISNIPVNSPLKMFNLT